MKKIIRTFVELIAKLNVWYTVTLANISDIGMYTFDIVKGEYKRITHNLHFEHTNALAFVNLYRHAWYNLEIASFESRVKSVKAKRDALKVKREKAKNDEIESINVSIDELNSLIDEMESNIHCVESCIGKVYKWDNIPATIRILAIANRNGKQSQTILDDFKPIMSILSEMSDEDVPTKKQMSILKDALTDFGRKVWIKHDNVISEYTYNANWTITNRVWQGYYNATVLAHNGTYKTVYNKSNQIVNDVIRILFSKIQIVEE